MTRKPILIYGAGGFGREVAWVVEAINAQGGQWDVIGFVDDDLARAGSKCEGLPVFGDIEEAASLAAGNQSRIFVSIGVGSPYARRAIAARLNAIGLFEFATLVHPAAVLGPHVALAAGALVTAGVIVGPRAVIGEHVALNVASGVGHDARVGAFSVVCPGARVSGSCELGEEVLIGSNAVIAPGRKVGKRAVVGALSFVVLNVPAGGTALGNPARTTGGGRTDQ